MRNLQNASKGDSTPGGTAKNLRTFLDRFRGGNGPIVLRNFFKGGAAIPEGIGQLEALKALFAQVTNSMY